MYIDLVGEERINREVLSWVKCWDFCVFGKISNNLAAQIGNRQIRKISKSGEMDMANSDKKYRPLKKILLLSGPPGFGKTTLVHVVAKHCGYSPIEINASDDRTGDSLKNKLMGAIENRSFMGNKPALVIIDEIDGASQTGSGDQNFMNILIDIATAGDKEESEVEIDDSGSDRNKKGGIKRNALMRPIICICNDLHAPVLRNLRKIAHIVTFQTPPLKSISKRLYEICKWESISTDLRTMMQLTTKTQGDLRNSLNTLQFLSKTSKKITIDVINSNSNGNKECQKSLFKVWEDVFWKLEGGDGNQEVLVLDFEDRYFRRLSEVIVSNGEYDKIIQGCFHNYLNMNIFDTTATTTNSITQVLNYLYFYDILNERIKKYHNFEFYGYLPVVISSFYKLFAGNRKPFLEFPGVELLYGRKYFHIYGMN